VLHTRYGIVAGVLGMIGAFLLATSFCGGFALQYGTTIDLALNHRPSSVVAVAAVTREDSNVALAWEVWDERGTAFLGLTKSSPVVLKRFWIFHNPPNFNNPGPRFTIMPKSLPPGYSLTYCSAATTAT